MHKATFELKLGVQLLAKQIAHEAAFLSPTLRQLTPDIVLARVSLRPLWTSEAWRAWCTGLFEAGPVAKAPVPLCEARRLQSQAVREHLLKRPACLKRPAACLRRPAACLRRPAASGGESRPKRKRTPFSLQRKGSWRTQGVRSTIFKGPAATRS